MDRTFRTAKSSSAVHRQDLKSAASTDRLQVKFFVQEEWRAQDALERQIDLFD
jgi:hypothetical protein